MTFRPLRSLCALLVTLGVIAGINVTTAPAAEAEEFYVAMFFTEEEILDVARAANYLGQDMNTFVRGANDVHYFLLAIVGKLDYTGASPGCALNYDDTIAEDTGDRLTFFLNENTAPHYKYGEIAAFYCLNAPQVQRFNMALLTFLVGANSNETGRPYPKVKTVPREQLFNGFKPIPEGWAEFIRRELVKLDKVFTQSAYPSAGPGCADNGWFDDRFDDIAFLYITAENRPDDIAPDLLDLLNDIYGVTVELERFACNDSTDAQLAATGLLAFLIPQALEVQTVDMGLSDYGTPFNRFEIRYGLNPNGPLLWDSIDELFEAQLTLGGLHAAPCADAGASIYSARAIEYSHDGGWATHIDSYIAANPGLAADAVTALREVRDVIIGVSGRLNELHGLRCQGNDLGNAAASARASYFIGSELHLLYFIGEGGSPNFTFRSLGQSADVSAEMTAAEWQERVLSG